MFATKMRDKAQRVAHPTETRDKHVSKTQRLQDQSSPNFYQM